LESIAALFRDAEMVGAEETEGVDAVALAETHDGQVFQTSFRDSTGALRDAKRRDAQAVRRRCPMNLSRRPDGSETSVAPVGDQAPEEGLETAEVAERGGAKSGFRGDPDASRRVCDQRGFENAEASFLGAQHEDADQGSRRSKEFNEFRLVWG